MDASATSTLNRRVVSASAEALHTSLMTRPRILFLSLMLAISVAPGVGLALPPPANPRTVPEEFERILIPLLVEPVHGANGSEFRTELTAVSADYSAPVNVFGLRTLPVAPFYDPATDPLTLERNLNIVEPFEIVPDGNPGRFVYVMKGSVDDLALNLRAFDVSRSPTNYGTQLPIVRERDFRAGEFALLSVPITGRFRSTLRLYAPAPTTVTVFFFGREVPGSPTIPFPQPVTISLRAGQNMFDPAYAAYSDFAIAGANGPQIVNLLITEFPEKILCPECPPSQRPVVPLWGFVSVTNNESQHITLSTPQP